MGPSLAGQTLTGGGVWSKLWCYILSSRVLNEVGVNMTDWDVF